MAAPNPLIGGYLEFVSARILEKYQAEITQLVRSASGLYALYRDRRLYYIGLTADLERRLKQHLRDRHAKQWNTFSLYLIGDAGLNKELESLLLRIMDPAGNRVGGRFSKATDLGKQLRFMLEKRQQAELNELLNHSPAYAQNVTSRSKGTGKPAENLKALFDGPAQIHAFYKGKQYQAFVGRDGRIKFHGRWYESPSAAGRAVRKRPTSGWEFWRVQRAGKNIPLKDLREAIRH